MIENLNQLVNYVQISRGSGAYIIEIGKKVPCNLHSTFITGYMIRISFSQFMLNVGTFSNMNRHDRESKLG